MPPRDFTALPEADARAHLAAYVAGLDERVAWLAGQLGAGAGGGDLGVDDDTLVDAWRWLLGWAPAHAGDDAEPPGWYVRDDPPRPDGLSAAELQAVDAVAAQLARVLQAAAPSLRWDIGKEPKRMRYIWQHAPVLKGYGWDVNPAHLVMALALRALRFGEEEARRPDALLGAHRHWLAKLGVAA